MSPGSTSGLISPSAARLLREFWPHRVSIAVIFLLGLIVSAVQPYCLKISQQILDELQKDGSRSFFAWIPWVLIGIFAVSGLAKYFYNSLRRYVSEKVILQMRERLYATYLYWPLATLDNQRTGDMMTSIQNDLTQIGVGVDTICDVFKEPFIFLGLMGMAFYWDWKLTLVTLLVAPIVSLLFSRSGAAVKRYSRQNLEQVSDIVSLGHESLAGARVVKVFHLEPRLLQKFRLLQARYFHTMGKSIRVQELATPSVEFIGACLMAAIIVYGRYRIGHGQLTTGQLVAFILALGLTQMPIKKLNNAFLKLKNAESAADRIYAVLDQPNLVLSNPGRIRKAVFNDTIEFRNVGLYYDDKRALQDVCFTAKRGECIAFVGPSGGGKSSILNCLPRLYDVTEGSIRIDGIDVRDIRIEDLRQLFSLVTQDIFLFNDTLFENIRYGKPDATTEQIHRAAEMAYCMDFIDRCPKGFESRVGDRGVQMSGGERQRLAIARALLKDAPILLLDEATSNLDSHSEEQVQKALRTLLQDRTSFLVAHRLASVTRADRIYVVERGRIHEEGLHHELVERGGLYHKLYEKQSEGFRRPPSLDV